MIKFEMCENLESAANKIQKQMNYEASRGLNCQVLSIVPKKFKHNGELVNKHGSTTIENVLVATEYEIVYLVS